jgi:hypothetical protein
LRDVPPPYDLPTVRLACEPALPMKLFQTYIDALADEGVTAVDAADWLRVMQQRRASFDDVLRAVRDGQSPSSWGSAS